MTPQLVSALPYAKPEIADDPLDPFVHFAP